MMSPKQVDPSMREQLVEAAAQIIATDGLAGLTLRRLTREVGTSTMAIYTHFGSMDELRHAIRREGFARMDARFRAIEQTDDPVADLSSQGWAYWRNAVENPNLYRAMFMHGGIDDPRAAVGETTFDMLVAAVQRCLDAGRFMPAEPRALAVQLWSMVHGICSLYLNEMLSEQEAIAALGDNFAALMAAFGDDADATRRSLAGATAA
jgi:AcrR family transcriptional regulator